MQKRSVGGLNPLLLLVLILLNSFAAQLLNAFSCLPAWWEGVEPIAQVDTSCALCPEERAHVQARQAVIEPAVHKFVGLEGVQLEKYPSVSLCFSGGAYRSMVCTQGFLLGAQEIGLLDTTKYISTLSGSTWTVANYMLRAHRHGVSLTEFRHILQKRIEKHIFDLSDYELDDFVKELWRIFNERLKFEAGDLWGAIIADRLFGDLRGVQDITFGEIRKFMKSGSCDMPFPLFALALSDEFPYEWLEVNPFITGSDYLGCYIPTSLLDTKFRSGYCYKRYRERSLGWFLGAFGSAYNFSFGDMLMFLSKRTNSARLINMLGKIIDENNLHERRFLTSPIHNFAWNMSGVPMSSRKNIEVSDAGMAFNLPIAFLLRENRKSDVIFACDASLGAENEDYEELRFASAYARRKGIKFPSIQNPVKIDEYVLLFEDESDPEVPTIVYFANPIPIKSRDFKYSKEQFDSVCDAMRDMVVRNREALAEVVRRKCRAAL